MHFALAREHLDFFYKHHYIEFEDLLTEVEVESLSRALQETLAKRLHSKRETLAKTDIKTLYLSGYDMWRDNPTIQKFVLRPQLAEIASNLTKVRPLRIGFDQLFTASENADHLFKKPRTLHQMSSIQGTVCGCILHLSSSAIPVTQATLAIEEDMTALIPIPKKVGSAIFFNPELPLSLEYLVETPHVLQLMIVYAEEKGIYAYQETDLHTHAFKKLGYGFGDRLRNATHPILYSG